MSETVEVAEPRIRYRHFHHVQGVDRILMNALHYAGPIRKGQLAGTACIVEDEAQPNILHVGFTVANPNDQLTREQGRAIAENNLDGLTNSVMITRSNFMDLAKSNRLYYFLCVATHKNPKIANRSVI